MVKLKTIKGLYIDKANYLVSGTNGRRAKIKINYATGQFDIQGKVQGELLKDLQIFAKDLIARKSRVNFA